MVPLTNRTANTRGAAALEFAFVIPAMLMVFGGIFGFGMVLWTQYVAAVTLQSTLRTCVAAQNSMSASASQEMVGCVTSQFATQAATTSLSRLCETPPQVSRVAANLLPTNQADQRPVYLLTATVRCTKNYFSLMKFYNFNVATAQIAATSALPFTP